MHPHTDLASPRPRPAPVRVSPADRMGQPVALGVFGLILGLVVAALALA
jgi:hypothetical protein